MRRFHTGLLLLMLLISPGRALPGAQGIEVRTVVSYVSATTIYLGAGRDDGLAAGDSARILDEGRTKGMVVIYAVSATSSASHALDSTAMIVPGDSAVVLNVRPSLPPASPEVGTRPIRQQHAGSPGTVVHGRIATQLFASHSVEGDWSLLQPSLLMRVDVSRILGSDLTFSFFGRTSRDFSQSSTGFSGNRGAMVRLYDMSLRYGASEGWLGIGLGRITSRNVSGLGAFDGGELSVRAGGLTVGVLGGGQPDYRTSEIDPDRRKFAGYLNYRFGEDGWSRSDVTLAYGRQYFRGTLDRDFVYVQTSISPRPHLFLYQSTEIDLHELKNGESTPGVHLTNTFLTLSWRPTEWLSTSAGYDAARPIVLLESMKTLSDTLLDRDLQQGLRASASVRLPMRLTASVTGGLRLKTETARQAHSYGGGIRMADLGGTGVTAGIQFLRTRALYSEGNDLTVMLESWITHWITATLRYNRYAYVITGQQDGATATTLSLAASMRLSGSWYALANLDRVWDPGRAAYRMVAELSYHF